MPDSGTEEINSSEEENSDREPPQRPQNKLKPVQKRKMTPRENKVHKRLRDEKTWIDKKAKKQLDFGVEHENRKGNIIQERIMKTGCGDSCRMKCQTKLTEENRQIIFTRFWEIGNHTRQWDFIARFVKTENKKQVTVKNRESRRNFSRQYNFFINDENVQICKKMFLNTLGISEQWITTALSKVNGGGTLTGDLRGLHTSRPNKLNPEINESVIMHIKSFPLVRSHYVRERTDKEYLEAGLTISKMYRMYIQNMEQENKLSVATLRQYRDIFNTKFNISFHKPKKDQCETCASFEMVDEKQKAEMLEKYNKHISNKNLARSLKNRDKELCIDDPTLCVACFDLQKVLQTPQSEVSDFYYKSKIATYNFTVYDLGTHEGFCYVWTELIARRGPNEIGSCLLKFLNIQSEKGVKKVILYSDNCGGQNRNRFVFSMFSYASKKLGIEIVHRFLEKGHTQNEGDSMHAIIENARKRLSAIYTPDQWVSLIRMAKVTGKPYIVTEMSQNDFFSFSQFVTFQNWKKSSDGISVKISQIKETKYLPETESEVWFKYQYDEEPLRLCLKQNIAKTRRSVAKSSQDIQELPLLYTQTLGIDEKKLNGLKELCRKNLIPKLYQNFYDSLKVKEKNGSKSTQSRTQNNQIEETSSSYETDDE